MGTDDAIRSPRLSEAAIRYADASLSGALFTTTQQRVLGRLFGEPGRSYAVNELIQSTGAGSGAVQRELAKLAGSGLLLAEQVGNQKRYRANPASPIHAELVAIVRKTFGVAAPLREALAPLAARIRAAFVYGSVAKGGDGAASDIDLLLVGDDLAYPDVMSLLQGATERIGREVSPTIYTAAEMRQRIDGGNAFLTRMLQQPRIWVYGSDDDIAA